MRYAHDDTSQTGAAKAKSSPQWATLDLDYKWHRKHEEKLTYFVACNKDACIYMLFKVMHSIFSLQHSKKGMWGASFNVILKHGVHSLQFLGIVIDST